MNLTILTPTYNRANYLNKCYKSLLHQTDKNFEWLIVDDGSTDNTSETVKKIISEEQLNIRYIYKGNGGKHTAVNEGVKHIDSDLTLILDSDDRLTENAVEEIYKLAGEYEDEVGICGFTFLKKFPDERLMGDKFPHEGRYNFIEWRTNYVVSGEYCDLFYTKYMREYPFSEYPGEKYIGESTVWIKLAFKYDMVCKNIVIYEAEYIEEGLTKSGRIMRVKCPNGGMEYSNLRMMKRLVPKRKIKASVLYTAYARLLRIPYHKMIKNSNNKKLAILMAPVGMAIAAKWEKEYLK